MVVYSCENIESEGFVAVTIAINLRLYTQS